MKGIADTFNNPNWYLSLQRNVTWDISMYLFFFCVGDDNFSQLWTSSDFINNLIELWLGTRLSIISGVTVTTQYEVLILVSVLIN